MAADGLQVDRTQSNAMNLQVLKRQDDSVMEIVDTASHVVMYEFDQDNQSWKRKDVEGCLFVVKRFSAPRFQIFVNNRLSTTNMTLAIDERLEVDNVDTFLILRSPDTSYATGYAIYGIWFFPEEDREKILNLLHRVIQSLKDPQNAALPAAPVNGAPASNNTPKTKQQQPQPQPQPQPQQQQQQQPQQQQQRSRGRSRNRRDNSNRRGSGNSGTPTAILQRSPQGNGNGSDSSSGKQENVAAAANTGSGMVPISKADGIAAGEAILGMISQNRPQTPPKHKKQANVSKEQLKQTLIGLLDDAQFFDQIYHAYVDRVARA